MVDHMQTQLEMAICTAVRAHEGQVDKAGAPYILHPFRVMAQLDDIQEKIVAALHDVLEDTEFTEKDLLEIGFDEYFINAVKTLSRARNNPYEIYLVAVRKFDVCRKVKIADLRDNLQIERLLYNELTQHDLDRIKKYQVALRVCFDFCCCGPIGRGARLKIERLWVRLPPAALHRGPRLRYTDDEVSVHK